MTTNQDVIDHMIDGRSARCPQCGRELDIGTATGVRAGRGWSVEERVPAPECEDCGSVDPSGIELQTPEYQSTLGFVDGATEVLK